MNRIVITLFLPLFAATLHAQQDPTRYRRELFKDVKVTNDIVYGMNATVLYLPHLGEAVPEPLLLDLYEPEGDNQSDRPLIVMFHSGNFLPMPQNGSTLGSKADSANVELATRLASMGYVVANARYRLGWNPIATTQTERVYTLINAAYRGVQDARTAAKYFRRNVAEMGNPYNIDPNKFIIWGVGTGGYISLNTAYLDNYLKIPMAPGGKFIIMDSVMGPIPMVIETINGDLNSDSIGIVPPGYPGFPAGDTLCYPNHVGYDGTYQLTVNMGGALGDTSWMNTGQIPCISYHVPSDPFAPYDIGLVIVPGLNLPVVEVAGSRRVQLLADRYNLNSAFKGIQWPNDRSETANLRNEGFDGLYPIIGSTLMDNGPWNWWDTSHPNHATNLPLNPDMGASKGKTYIDTIIRYFAARSCLVFNMCNTPEIAIGINELPEKESIQLRAYPVPAYNALHIESADHAPIREVRVYALDGRLVQSFISLDSERFTLYRRGLPSGQYLLYVLFDGHMATKHIFFFD